MIEPELHVEEYGARTLLPVCPELTFDDDAHRYEVLGVDHPSVTTIISAFRPMGFERAKASGRMHANHATIGSLRHLATELDDAGELDESALDEKLMNAVAAWRDFRRAAGFTPTAIEERVFSRRHEFAGTIDRVGTTSNGERLIIDIKGSFVSPTYPLQLAAYRLAWQEVTGERINRACCVHLHNNAKFKVATYGDEVLDGHESAFVALATAHRIARSGWYDLGLFREGP